MTKHITVPSYNSTQIHLGSSADYENIFRCSYFVEKETNDNYLNKSIINSFKYEPDSTYKHTDRNSGTCWIAEVVNPEEEYGFTYYHFRDFQDLIQFYKEKGYEFILN